MSPSGIAASPNHGVHQESGDFANLAQGGDAAESGMSGEGSGGGLYLATGSTTTLTTTIVAANFASTSDDNVLGTDISS